MNKIVYLAILISVFCLSNAQVKGETNMIADGKKVQFDYKLTVDGQVVDSSEGKTPLEYVHGEGKIIKGLEKEMEGLVVGDSRTVTVAAAEGYGEVNKEALREVPRAEFPPNIDPEVGQQLAVTAPDGQPVPVSVAEVRDDVIVIDFNHPLAGKELTFDVTIVSVD